MTIHIYGPRGMLGRAVSDLARARGVDYRTHVWPGTVYIEQELHAGDVLINCAGRIPAKLESAAEMIASNAVLPHILAEICLRAEARMIHVSTDCVYGPLQLPAGRSLSVGLPPAPLDLYGRSKLLGEVDSPGVTNVRTSFVGPDHGLWAWIAEQPTGAVIEGWTNHRWSGSTVWEVAAYLMRLATWPAPRGIRHAATEVPISKYEAVRSIRDHLDRFDIEVIPNEIPTAYRALMPTGSGDVLRPFAEALEDAP